MPMVLYWWNIMSCKQAWNISPHESLHNAIRLENAVMTSFVTPKFRRSFTIGQNCRQNLWHFEPLGD